MTGADAPIVSVATAASAVRVLLASPVNQPYRAVVANRLIERVRRLCPDCWLPFMVSVFIPSDRGFVVRERRYRRGGRGPIDDFAAGDNNGGSSAVSDSVYSSRAINPTN